MLASLKLPSPYTLLNNGLRKPKMESPTYKDLISSSLASLKDFLESVMI